MGAGRLAMAVAATRWSREWPLTIADGVGGHSRFFLSDPVQTQNGLFSKTRQKSPVSAKPARRKDPSVSAETVSPIFAAKTRKSPTVLPKQLLRSVRPKPEESLLFLPEQSLLSLRQKPEGKDSVSAGTESIAAAKTREEEPPVSAEKSHLYRCSRNQRGRTPCFCRNGPLSLQQKTREEEPPVSAEK